jgi:hypothetical protein
MPETPSPMPFSDPSSPGVYFLSNKVCRLQFSSLTRLLSFHLSRHHCNLLALDCCHHAFARIALAYSPFALFTRLALNLSFQSSTLSPFAFYRYPFALISPDYSPFAFYRIRLLALRSYHSNSRLLFHCSYRTRLLALRSSHHHCLAVSLYVAI